MRKDSASIAVRSNLGARIRRLRTERGLSQRVFAEMIAMDRSYLISIEKGRRNISLDNLAKIAHGLGLPLSDMLREVDSYIYEHINLTEE